MWGTPTSSEKSSTAVRASSAPGATELFATTRSSSNQDLYEGTETPANNLTDRSHSASSLTYVYSSFTIHVWLARQP